jgi:hypothetical protein
LAWQQILDLQWTLDAETDIVLGNMLTEVNIGMNLSGITGWVKALQGLPWIQMVARAWQYGMEHLPGFSRQGVYEVLDYESTLELLNMDGTKAVFKKRKKIRYLQDEVIAYQDHAWGDGDILHNYRTSRGKPVDQYRYGYKTYILLSLREVQNRGDIDEFNIQWNIRHGFLKPDGYWATDVSQPMRQLKINVIFPKTRPPQQLSMEESNHRRTTSLDRNAQQRLPDGRWLVTWEMNNPRLHELYVLRWIW